ELVEPRNRAHAHLLHEVLGVVARSGEPIGDAIQRVVMREHQRLEPLRGRLASGNDGQLAHRTHTLHGRGWVRFRPDRTPRRRQAEYAVLCQFGGTAPALGRVSAPWGRLASWERILEQRMKNDQRTWLVAGLAAALGACSSGGGDDAGT